MAWGVSFRGFALDSTNGITVENVSENASVNVREQKLKEGGSSLDLLSLASRTITLSGKIHSDSASGFKTALRAFLAKVNDPSEGDLILDALKLSCVAIPQAINYGPLVTSANWSIRFVSGEKFWKTATATTASGLIGKTSATLSTTLSYDADYAEVLPTWTLTSLESGAISDLSITITNSTTGEEFRVSDFDVGPSDVLTIDPDAESVYYSTSSSGVSTSPKRIDGSFWAISGASVSLTATLSTTSLSDGFTLGVSYYPRHYSFGE